MANDVNMSPIIRGDTKTFNLSLKNKNGSVIDVSGMDLFFTLKKKIADTDAQAAIQKQITLPDDDASRAGECKITITSTDTDALDTGVYFYDFQLVEPGNPPKVTTLAQGKVAILADVTRRVS